MQFNVMGFSPAMFMYDEWSGLYERDGKKLYINDGIGSVGFIARIGARPEITVIDLKYQK
jgi:predicted MPP superfamily phosphohydrolase